ncbi:DUF4382 domain-containing protein [Ferrimonas sp. YFM]|uniref:DUF4382 domain-containing protein n=1 Tax=Ferrimonas sp. YFM TaxID=3028878 RepID=UPI002572C507|nr:DUF4382 domain-containing protein [Ferrimonas sp. YFM]BDY03030.1 lipoprotein [Ferrimonas sp. YFM]
MNPRYLLVLPLLYGCGGSDSTPAPQDPEPPQASLSVAVSDAPMDGAEAVVMAFHRMVLTPVGGGQAHNIDLSQHRVNMLDYQQDRAHWLFEDHPVPAGRYHLRLEMEPGSGDQGSYVDDHQGRHALRMEQRHIDLGEMELGSGQHQGFTLEMDLRQGLYYDPEQGYGYGHNGWRWVDNQTMGHLMGSVDEAWIQACEADNADKAADGGVFYHTAYLYPAETGFEAMDDMALEAEAAKVLPIATAYVHQLPDGSWGFGMGFLPEGEYQVGYSCLGHLDQPETNEDAESGFAFYGDGGSVIIDAGEYGGQRNGHRCGGQGGGGPGHGGRG